MLAPVMVKLVAPGVLLSVPGVQAPLSSDGLGLLESTMPSGKLSVSVIPLKGTEPLAVLSITRVIWEEPPPLMEEGENPLFTNTLVAVAAETVSAAVGLLEQV